MTFGSLEKRISKITLTWLRLQPEAAVALMVLTVISCRTVSDQERRIDELMRAYDGEAVPGASVLVVRDGDVIFRKSYGMADLEERRAAAPSTHYRLASITKQFTAAAILDLAEGAKLSLDDSVRRFLPTLPPYADAITIRQLLTHTGGIADYEDLIPDGATRQLTDADVLALVAKRTWPEFLPGTRYHYSNTGYALLALIVERVSGMSFADSLRQRIFQPHGMRTSVAHQEGISTVPDRAFGYSRDGDRWTRTDQSLTSAVLGDGGIYASIDELTHWLGALEGGRFAEAARPLVETDDARVRYGFGWRVGEHKGRRTVGHTGETRGFRNALVRFPDEGVAVVILTNRNDGVPNEIALKIADLLIEGTP
jgi:CubicO group peptidase (beta-lactamase class C family)